MIGKTELKPRKIVLEASDQRYKPNDHNGNISGEILDIIQYLGYMNSILLECAKGNTIGAVDAMIKHIEKANIELNDLKAKIVAEGIFQQTSLLGRDGIQFCPGEKKAPSALQHSEPNPLLVTGCANITNEMFAEVVPV